MFYLLNNVFLGAVVHKDISKGITFSYYEAIPMLILLIAILIKVNKMKRLLNKLNDKVNEKKKED